jgi:hypothetical protein
MWLNLIKNEKFFRQKTNENCQQPAGLADDLSGYHCQDGEAGGLTGGQGTASCLAAARATAARGVFGKF